MNENIWEKIYWTLLWIWETSQEDISITIYTPVMKDMVKWMTPNLQPQKVCLSRIMCDEQSFTLINANLWKYFFIIKYIKRKHFNTYFQNLSNKLKINALHNQYSLDLDVAYCVYFDKSNKRTAPPLMHKSIDNMIIMQVMN